MLLEKIYNKSTYFSYIQTWYLGMLLFYIMI